MNRTFHDPTVEPEAWMLKGRGANVLTIGPQLRLLVSASGVNVGMFTKGTDAAVLIQPFMERLVERRMRPPFPPGHEASVAVMMAIGLHEDAVWGPYFGHDETAPSAPDGELLDAALSYLDTLATA